MPESIRVNFEELAEPVFPDLPIRVRVSGPFTRRGGATFAARVGRQAVEAITLRADGTGFVGYLPARPSGGDELILERGDFVVETGARFIAAAAAHGGDLDAGAAALVANVPPPRQRELCRDVPRGAQRYGADGAPVAMTTAARSWIVEDAGLTPDARAFKPRSRDKTCRVVLSVRVPRLPAGGTVRWSVPTAHRGSITLSGDPAVMGHVHTGARVEILGLVPGLTNVDVEALDGSGRVLESIKFPLCVPQFVRVDDSGASSQAMLTRFNLGAEKELVFEVAKEVCDVVLTKANVRMVWSMAPFSERLPAQFASGGLGAARVTVATIGGEPPRLGHIGQTWPPFAWNIFNELIDVWPGAYTDDTTGSAVEEVDDMTAAAVTSIAGMTNMSTEQKNKVVTLVGRLIGESLAHEIGHSLIGVTIGVGDTQDHNPPLGTAGATPHSLMNRGADRSLADRTGFRPIASPISLDDAIEDPAGVAAINVPTGKAQARIDLHFPVPGVFA